MAEAIRQLLHCYLPGTMYESRQCLFYVKSLLLCGNETELYLMVCHVFYIHMQGSCHFEYTEKKMCKDIYEIVMPHCSDEIKMHFNDAFKELVFSDIN